MSVSIDPSGRRSVRVEVLVPGTPEVVWQAVATGPGISAWFVPSTVEGRVGGAVSCDFGGGMVSSARITAWDAPRRFVAVDGTWLQGGPEVATTWTVQPQGEGRCLVSVEHSFVSDRADWDPHLLGTEDGWPGYFRVLAHYLAHHAGKPARSSVAMVPAHAPAHAAWQRLLRAVGQPELAPGQSFKLSAKSSALEGRVVTRDDLPQGQGVMVALEAPAPGVAMLSAMDCMGMQMAILQLFFYGPQAAAAADAAPVWQEWLAGLFPAPTS